MGLRAGKRPARKADGTAEEGCWRKRMLPCNGGDRDCVSLELKGARSSLAKASRIPAGLVSRENLSEGKRRSAIDGKQLLKRLPTICVLASDRYREGHTSR
jgi:hypothetical protein